VYHSGAWSNKNLDPSTIPAPVWGSITGTLSSQTDLQTALNGKQNLIYQQKNIAFAPSLTGTTTETQLIQLFIPANTFASSDIININDRYNRVGTANSIILRYKMSTSASMPAGTTGQFATVVMGTSNQHLGVVRQMRINGGNLSGINNVSNQPVDTGVVNIGQTSQAFDVTVDNYFYISATLNNATDTLVSNSFTLNNL
jgi:hypothetical protein